MKITKITGLIVILLSCSIGAFGQLWKQYADSAKVYSVEKNTDKAIEFYSREKNELQGDSTNTMGYAKICDSLAVLFYLKQQYSESEKFDLQAKQIKEKVSGKESADYAGTCANLALIYQALGLYDKAEPLYISVRKIREKLWGKTNADYSTSCTDLGTLYWYMGLYEKVEPLYIEAKHIQEKLVGKEHADYATSCNNLGLLYLSMKQYEKTEPLLLEAKLIRAKVLGKEHPDYIASCNRLALVYSYMEQYGKAVPLFQEVKQIEEKLVGKEHPDYATSCTNLGTLYWHMRKYDKAEPLFVEAKKIQEAVSGKENFNYVSSDINLGSLYISIGHFEQAKSLFQEVMEIQEKLAGTDNASYSTACANLAFVYFSMGQYEKAVPLFLAAIKTQEKVIGTQNAIYAIDVNNLANNYRYMGQYEKAEQLYLEAKKIYANLEGTENADYANSDNSLAALYDEMGLYEKAVPLYLDAKQIQEKVMGKNHTEYALSCNNLGGLYMDMGRFEEARKLFHESQKVYGNIEGKENTDYALPCESLAILDRETGHYWESESLFLQAKRVFDKVLGKEHPFYAFCCDDLANLYMKEGKYRKAEPLFIEAEGIREKVLGKQHPDYGSTATELANLYWVMQRPLDAVREFNESFSVNAHNLFSIFQFTNEKEKTAYIKNKLGEDEIAYSFYLAEKIKSGEPYSLSLFHRNLILLSSEALKNQIPSSNDSSMINKYNDWLSLKEYLAVLYSMPVADRKEDPSKIEAEADEEEKDLTRLSSEFKNQRQKIDWKDIQNKLQPDEASVEFVAFHYYNGRRFTDSTYYLALVLRRELAFPEPVRLFEKKQLDALLIKSERLTGDQTINSLYTRSSALYNLVWKPLDKYLKGITRVYFAPAGNLYKISFAAIPINAQQVLSDKYKLVQLNTTANILDSGQSTINAGDNIQLYGGIQYDADSVTLEKAAYAYRREIMENSRSLPDDLQRGAGFQYLPGTFQEVEAIKELGDHQKESITVVAGTDATEESVKALSGKASPSVLHFATHGFFFPDPKSGKMNGNHKRFNVNGEAFKQSDNPLFRSGLLFAGANNAWKGKPIEGIDDGILTSYEVSNMYLPNTKLVVLSACNSALGDIQGSEGVYGLQRAFKMAGAQYLVMSLWKVLDKETSEFMRLFYKNLFAEQTINNAFYNAQQAMKNRYRSEPSKWAAWVLVK